MSAVSIGSIAAPTLYGHTLDSDLAFQRARSGEGPRGRIEVRRAEVQAAPRGSAPAVSVGHSFTVHREGDALTVWCEATGTFGLDPASSRVAAAACAPEGPALEHRLACVMVPLLLAERGDLVLHASAVQVGDRAVAFAAPSGRGKSTIAWALGTRGFAVLAEDGCVVTPGPDGPRLWPGLAGVRLIGTDGKHTVAGGGGSADPVPLAAVVILGERGGRAPALEPVPAARALTALMPNTMHAQGPSLAAAFRGSAALVRSVPILHGWLPDALPDAAAHAQRLLDMAVARAA